VTEPSQFLVTDDLLDGIELPEELSAESLGRRSLKGVRELVAVTSLSGQPSAPASRLTDPVCGMSVKGDDVTRTWSGNSWAFCSPQCADAFEADPDRYLVGPQGHAL
jgi:YHS domain-containing protein